MTRQRTDGDPGAIESGTGKLRILCAEDDEHVATMLRYALERSGHVVEQVGDGSDALTRINADPNRFALLVTDHEMPSVSGLQLVEEVRRTAFAGRIVIHSSELRAPDAAAYLALSVDHIFTKPARLEEFITVVNRLVGVAP